MKRWNSEKGFGFIQPDQGGDDLFCHVSGLLDGDGSVQEGDSVNFKITFDDRKGKDRATDVTSSSGGRRGGGGGGGRGRSRSRGGEERRTYGDSKRGNDDRGDRRRSSQGDDDGGRRGGHDDWRGSGGRDERGYDRRH